MKPENILVCLTNDELKLIQETGTYNINKNNKTKFSINDLIKERKNLIEERKKNQIRQIKRMERNNISNEIIEERIKKIMEIEDEENIIFNTNDIINENNNNFDINDLIERPRINSVPKYNIDFLNSQNENKSSINSSEMNISVNIENDSENNEETNNPFDINLKNYNSSLNDYLKEKNRIIHDINYRKFILSHNSKQNNL